MAKPSARSVAPGSRRAPPGSGIAPLSASPWLLLILIGIVALAYFPAWFGGMLWDDDGHLIAVPLRTAHGLWRIWFDPGTTQQYYPVVYTAFWIQARLWGDHYVGYHLVSLTLHAASSFLLFAILRRLKIAGAGLAAVLFALHPVHVESVAWISELKNTLSGVLYMGSALAYLRFDEGRRRAVYGLSLALFAAALLSKSVTVTLPAGLLTIFWWQRGRLRWREDVVPLLPFFAIGAMAAATTAWFERTFVGATGHDFQLTLLERVLVAGRAGLFYLGKIAWPTHLSFNYERWAIDASDWSQYAWPIVLIGLLAAAWAWRARFRGPFAALAFFLVTLSPALGFVDVYPFRYSFVADHFQYLASLGPLVWFSAVLSRWTEARRTRSAEWVVAVCLGLPLALLTWHQSSLYRDGETLYRATLDENPRAWLAQNNLATLIVHRSPEGQQEALSRYQEAVRLNPSDGMLRDNLATTLAEMGRPEEALAEQRQAAALAPRYPAAHLNLGIDLQNAGRFAEAIEEYRKALALDPALTRARTNLGLALAADGHLDEAIADLTTVVASDPQDVDGRVSLGNVLAAAGQAVPAADQYRAALIMAPGNLQAHLGLALVLLAAEHADEALDHARAAVTTAPGDAVAHDVLGRALAAHGQVVEAVSSFEAAVALERRPADLAAFKVDLGQALLRTGRRDEAIASFQAALALTPSLPEALAGLRQASGR